MELIFNGELSFPSSATAEVLKALEKKYLLPAYADNIEQAAELVIVNSDKQAILEYEDSCLGDSYDDLACVVKELYSKGIKLDGVLNYYGDYDGRYEVHDGEVEDLDQDAVAIRDAVDEVLIRELESRGYEVREKEE